MFEYFDFDDLLDVVLKASFAVIAMTIAIGCVMLLVLVIIDLATGASALSAPSC